MNCNDPLKIRFALNTHGPTFENYSLLCIKSIRHACGDKVLIRAYQPDNLPPISDRAARFYERHNVEVVSFHNEFLPDYLEDLSLVPARHLTYNKLYTLLDIEPNERRIFIDADILFLKDPTDYFQQIQEPTACVAVDTPESFTGSWRELYQNLGVPFPQDTIEVWETYVYGNAPEPKRLQILPYLCSGLVVADHRSTLPTEWLAICREIEANIHWLSASFFVDQVGLSVAVQKTGQPWYLIPRNLHMTYQIWRYVNNPMIFHYVSFDTLASAYARFPELKPVMNYIVPLLAKEDNLDLRFQLLTQWPRWWRRGWGLISKQSEKIFRQPLTSLRERN